MGKVQTSCRGSKSLSRRRPLFPFRREDAPGHKETQTAQGHRRSTKETRASVRIAGSRWRQPRAQGLQTSAKAVSPQTSSGTGHTRLATEKWVMERMQKNNPKRSLVNEWRGYNIVNTRSFYGSFQAQKNYPLAKYIFLLNKHSRERNEHLIGERKSKKRIKTKSCVKM